MKFVVIIGDGMADWPLEELKGRTPLQAALTPNMDRLAREGTTGLVRTVPEGFHPGSDVANLSILGYDPQRFYTGRAPLEAASIGVPLKDTDVAYRCNLVSLKFNKKRTRALMEDYSAGHISTDESRALMETLNREINEQAVRFYPGVSYRNLMVWEHGEVGADCTAPHDITGKDITDYLPQGQGSDLLNSLMLNSVGILEGHGVNAKRIEAGKSPANSIWLWGQGRKPSLPTYMEKYGLRGALVSAVDLTKGLGIYAGLRILNVPGATGYLDTNYVGKAEHTLEALEELDFVYLHVEAPDEAGHSGNVSDKIKAIEDFDALVVGTVMRGLKGFDDYRVMLLPDHATPIEVKTHTDEPVPFAILDSRAKGKGGSSVFNEDISKDKGIIMVEKGHELMDMFVKGGK